MNCRKGSKEGEGRGGGGNFQSENLCCRFWETQTGFLSMKLIQKSNFRVQGMFFNKFIEKNQNKTHFEECSTSHTSLRDGLRDQIGQGPLKWTQINQGQVGCTFWGSLTHLVVSGGLRSQQFCIGFICSASREAHSLKSPNEPILPFRILHCTLSSTQIENHPWYIFQVCIHVPATCVAPATNPELTLKKAVHLGRLDKSMPPPVVTNVSDAIKWHMPGLERTNPQHGECERFKYS